MNNFIRDHALDAMRIAGAKVSAGRDDERAIEVFNPFTAERIGTVPKATLEEVRQAFEAAHAFQPKLTRYERAAILMHGDQNFPGDFRRVTLRPPYSLAFVHSPTRLRKIY